MNTILSGVARVLRYLDILRSETMHWDGAAYVPVHFNNVRTETRLSSLPCSFFSFNT